MTETQALAEFGKKQCTVPGYESCWVRFKTSGYPHKLRREYDDAKTATAIWAIVTRYVAEWQLTDLTGQPVPFAPELDAVDNVEDAVVSWLIRAFTDFWLRELLQPRPNS